MTKENAKKPKDTHPQPEQEDASLDAGPEHVHRASAMQRMIDIKKSYDFWQDLVSKNVRKKLRSGRSSESAREKEAAAERSRDDALSAEYAEVYNDIVSRGTDSFSEQDLHSLRKRLDEIVARNGFKVKESEVDRLVETCLGQVKKTQGFDPYGNEDEEGLHDDNAGPENTEAEELHAQDDYDVEEVRDENKFSYEYPSRHHHFEVELSDGPPGAEADADEPSCEFTFEYDRDGKLIPTANNIEEKLRLMNLQSQISSEALSSAQAQASAIAQASSSKKKKKTKKKKSKAKGEDEHGACGDAGSNVCLFCQYEDFYGVKPVYSRRRQDFTHKWEMERRMKIREKLESAKSGARLRHEQRRHDEHAAEYDSEGSHGTVQDA
ncbi:hypothetical protein OXX80_010622 [Metschnikowia pulcherrima]